MSEDTTRKLGKPKQLRMEDRPPLLSMVWALHEGLRRLGFSADDIYVQVARNGRSPLSGLWVFVTLKTQDKEFVIHVAPLGRLAPEDFFSQWTAFVKLINAGAFLEGEMQRHYKHYFLDREPSPTDMVIALTDKGFVLPRSAS